MKKIDNDILKIGETSKISFSQVVKYLSDEEVISIDKDQKEHRLLLESFSKILNEILKETESTGGIQFSPGDNIPTVVNAWLSEQIQEKLKSSQYFKIKSSKWAGYPRFILSSNLGDIYLSIKTTSKTEKSVARTFYLSATKATKIKSKGFHISILMTYDLYSEEDIPVIDPKTFEISDLTRITLSKKLEFNAGTSDLEKGNVSKIEFQDLIK